LARQFPAANKSLPELAGEESAIAAAFGQAACGPAEVDCAAGRYESGIRAMEEPRTSGRLGCVGRTSPMCHWLTQTSKGANLTGCRVYGVSAWGLKLTKRTKQQNLVITPSQEPKVTVDNI
jgi:hypothetical protein